MKDKVYIHNYQKESSDHLSLYNKIDLALDTFPYNGVTTTFESVLMCVPVLTLKGFNFNSRCGESINKNLNLQNFIAENYDDYYLKALDFYKNRVQLKELRKTLRDKAISSPLFDNKNFTSIFSEKIKVLWENFLKTN
jgi:predicted O-linked N-acetylglucosamine transferase (SPINDLY family)